MVNGGSSSSFLGRAWQGGHTDALAIWVAGIGTRPLPDHPGSMKLITDTALKAAGPHNCGKRRASPTCRNFGGAAPIANLLPDLARCTDLTFDCAAAGLFTALRRTVEELTSLKTSPGHQ
jgi:hypothetical protein